SRSSRRTSSGWWRGRWPSRACAAPDMSGEDNAFRELLDEYVVECLPLAERVADAFVELERAWRAGQPGDELVAAARGWLHTVKGNSAMMGLGPMQELAHALEDLTLHRGDEVAALLVEGAG